MSPMRLLITILFVAVLCAMCCAQRTEFKAMTWNILHGGRDDGKDVGPQRVIEVIKASGADIVAMQETYGSGELIAKALGYRFQARGTNVSIHSKFPIVEDISVFEEFKCVGALIELPNQSKIAFYSIWLPYNKEIWEEGTRNVKDVADLLGACASSASDLAKMRTEIASRLSDPKYAGVPVIIAGDFNSMSHLDYLAVSVDQYGATVDWPTSHVLIDAGFRDAFRELHPTVQRTRDRTWSPRYPKQEQDRIDFCYYQGQGLEAIESQNISEHAVLFPSDHSAVLTKFRYDPRSKPPSEIKMRVVSYNIRHGAGMDDSVQIARTADFLQELGPDIVGLQEVDLNVNRSGSVNQPYELGRRLGMHAAFGAFMDYDGGQYGMAILSKYPLRNVKPIQLPVGEEPRIALTAEVRLPSGESLTIVNVHFDWIDDDKSRFAQATALAEYLRQLKTPYVLLGDFNDTPGSRTISLFQSMAGEAKKPVKDQFTFSSTKPEKEIDFIFFSPAERWQARDTRVLNEKLVSDHRPVMTELVLKAIKN